MKNGVCQRTQNVSDYPISCLDAIGNFWGGAHIYILENGGLAGLPL
jgi:hypothetical protein